MERERGGRTFAKTILLFGFFFKRLPIKANLIASSVYVFFGSEVSFPSFALILSFPSRLWCKARDDSQKTFPIFQGSIPCINHHDQQKQQRSPSPLALATAVRPLPGRALGMLSFAYKILFFFCISVTKET